MLRNSRVKKDEVGLSITVIMNCVVNNTTILFQFSLSQVWIQKLYRCNIFIIFNIIYYAFWLHPSHYSLKRLK